MAKKLEKNVTEKVIGKTGVEKPLKKIKSINLDDRVYSGLMEILESSGSPVTLSALVDDYFRKLFVYMIEAEGLLKKEKSDIPLSNVLYDCLNIEYFREPGKKYNRIMNLIWANEASKQGLSLTQWFRSLPEAALYDMGVIE